MAIEKVDDHHNDIDNGNENRMKQAMEMKMRELTNEQRELQMANDKNHT